MDVNRYLVNTLFAVKPSNTARTSTTTLAGDPDLTVPVLASSTYELSACIQYTAGTQNASDMKFNFAALSGATLNGAGVSGGAGSPIWTPTVSHTTTWTILSPGVGVIGSMQIQAVLIVASTPGNLTFQWAQNTSSGTATTVLAGSSMLLRQVA